jgi:hypothetical protein
MTNFSNFSKFNELYRQLKNLNITKEEYETFETLSKSLEYKHSNHIESNKCLDLTYFRLRLNDESLAELVNNNKEIFANAEDINLCDHDITNLDCLSICENLKRIHLAHNEKLTNIDGLNACKNLKKIVKY